MSYLDVPRLHFLGNFLANPSTVNNDPCHFDPSNPITDPWWNPNGNHYWQFRNCVIKALLMVGSNAGDQDSLLGAPVASTDQYAGSSSPAKLVDLDPEQQMVSQIFGLQLKVGLSDRDYFIGNFRPVPFNDIFSRVPSSGPPSDSFFSAYYQSVLDVVSWSSTLTSPFLKALQAGSPKILSIKFVVDAYDDDSASPGFTLGRIAGTIGPASPDEPINFVAERLLRPIGNSPLNFAPCRVDSQRRRLLLDLGNCVPATSPGGPPPDLGQLQVAILPPSSNPVIIGPVDYSLSNYQNAAGIQEIPLTPEQISQLSTMPLAVVKNGTTVLLAENPSGIYINATQYVYRMNPGGDPQQVQLIATRFGAPAAGETIALALNNSALQPAANCTVPVGTPADALKFPSSVITDQNGQAEFTITAAAPGNPRKFIDGQVYGVGFSSSKDTNPDPSAILSLLIFDSTNIPSSPTWLNDVEPILRPYSRLYPYMDQLLNLDDYTAIQQGAPMIAKLMTLPIEDPRYMPVTRDMSRDKATIILNWIKNGAPMGQKPDV